MPLTLEALSKALNSQYFLAKVKVNPLHYSFKDRLICLIHPLAPKSITCFDDTEGRLLNKMLSLIEEKSHSRERIMEPLYVSEKRSMLSRVKREALQLKSEIHLNDSQPWMFNEHLFLNVHNVENVLNLPKKLTSDTYTDYNFLNPVFNILIALKDNSTSLLKHILCLDFDELTDMKFEDIENLKFFEKNLKSDKDVSYLKITDGTLKTTCWGHNDIIPCFPEDRAIISEWLKETYIYITPYVLEMLYTVQHLKNPCKEEIENMFIDTYMDNSFLNLFYHTDSGRLVYTSEAETYLKEEDPNKRYEMLKNVKTIFNIDKLKTYDYVPYLINSFVNYILELNFRHLRIKTISIILDTCKEMKLNIYEAASKYLKETEDLELPSELKDRLESMEGASKSTSSKKDLVEFEREERTGGLASGGTPKEDTSSATIEELDKKFAEFKDDKYSFKTKIIENPGGSHLGSGDSKARYEVVAESVSLINKNLIRRIKDIKVYNTGGKNSGQTKGKLDKTNIHKYKTSSKIFYNNTYKIKECDLAFGIILDVSGSMSGENIKNGRITMIVLHETLKALNINHSIITHTNRGGMYSCDIKRYQLFKEDKHYNINKNYELINIEAEHGNCDSGALYYMEKAISRVRNKDKIVIMFSDGEPTECTSTDLKEQVRRMERKGIKVIGVGIKHPKIAEYYTDYANGNNLKEMLDIVAKILERYVLEKKD